MTTSTQIRGNCQCCGNVQAVRGSMSKHGYTVHNGWFSGVCSGHNFAPMQVSRDTTDNIVLSVRKSVKALIHRISALKNGVVTPEFAQFGYKRFEGKPVMIAFADAEKYAQDFAVETEVSKLEYRVKEGNAFADYLEKTVNSVHGKDLAVVAKPVAATRIQTGEKRLDHGRVMVAMYQDGARVYWKITKEDGKTITSWTGSKAWRSLPLAE